MPESRTPHYGIAEQLSVGMLLAFVGGFLDAYTYLTRGGVFAYAQTGNMIVMSIRLAEGDLWPALASFIPILTFFTGVFLAEWMRKRFHYGRRFHFQQILVACECTALAGIGLVPASAPNLLVTVSVSFLSALQVCGFRSLEGSPYATTMCTGNLRAATENLCHFLTEKDRAAGRRSLRLFLIIFIFCAGAAAGTISCRFLGSYACLLCCAVLLIVLSLLSAENRKSA